MKVLSLAVTYVASDRASPQRDRHVGLKLCKRPRHLDALDETKHNARRSGCCQRHRFSKPNCQATFLGPRDS